MRILDLTHCQRFSPSEAATAKNVIEQYSTIWAGNPFEPVSLSDEEIAVRRLRIIRYLTASEELLRNNHLSTDSIIAALLIGNGSANGHACIDGDRSIAWFALECFESDQEAKVFAMHELIHALHYSVHPEFGFSSREEKNLISRQLITEGVATYLTKSLLNVSDEEALWADSLSKRQIRSWMAVCRNSERELSDFTLRNFDSSDPTIELFYASNPSNLYSFRAGYYIGLRVIEAICDDHGLIERELLSVPLGEMRSLVMKVLSEQKIIG